MDSVIFGRCHQYALKIQQYVAAACVEYRTLVLKARVLKIRREFLMFVTFIKVTPSFTEAISPS